MERSKQVGYAESSMTVNSITPPLLTVLVVSIALPWIFPHIWEPLDCKCPTHFSEENCQYANAYCWTRGLRHTESDDLAWRDSVEHAQFGQEFSPRVFVILFVVSVLLLVPHTIKQAFQVNKSTIHLAAVCGTILAFIWLDFTLKTSFAKWGWHRFQQIRTHDSKTWHIFTQEKACDFKAAAGFYTVKDHEHTVNSEDHEYTKNVDVRTLQCAMTVNAWSEDMFLVLWAWLVLSGFVNFVKLVIAVFKLRPRHKKSTPRLSS
ncbi:innexin-6-like [Littorina saxatilis]|uniref:innexin-6-like n=1 Tax=Littorina saxatilis TaxID=31220 RepID=UPI0038B68571